MSAIEEAEKWVESPMPSLEYEGREIIMAVGIIENLITELESKNKEIERYKAVVDDVANVFHIGEKARTRGTILANVENSSRRSDCLSRIESYLSKIEIDEDGEEVEESLLNWGESPDNYIKRFIEALSNLKEQEE